ncbi:MAG: DNA polymerase III subunit delta [Bacteroidia bacterium]
MNFEQIVTDLKNKVFHPVYFLAGEEPYFIDELSDYIEKNILTEAEKSFDQTVFYGRDADAQTIFNAARRYPMLSAQQVIIVKEAQNVRDLVKEDGGKNKSALLTYLENPQRSSILVLCYKYKKIDKRTALAKALSKKAVFFESAKLYENKIPDWIQHYLQKENYSIHPKAALLLAEYLGSDLAKIANELDKLMISIPPKSEISADDIQKNIGISKDYNVFELHNAFGKKDVLKINQIINYFAADPREHPLVMTIGTLGNYFSKLMLYHSLADKSKGTVAATLGVHPFFVGDYERAAKNYSLGKIKNIFSYLREYDLKSKGYENISADEKELLRELAFKIIH